MLSNAAGVTIFSLIDAKKKQKSASPAAFGEIIFLDFLQFLDFFYFTN